MMRRALSVLIIAVGAAFYAANVSAGLLSTVTSTLGGLIQPVNVIVRLAPGTDVDAVLGLLDGVLLDDIPGADTYLVSVPSIPLILPVGVEYIEPDTSVSLPAGLQVGLWQPTAETPALWYEAQPALQLVGSSAAHQYATGQGVVVADIDAGFDYGHPALASRLVPGYDFVADQNTAGSGSLDQTGTTNLLQSSTSYLFQSSTSYLFEEFGLNFLSTTTDNPGITHGTFTAGLIAATAPGAGIMPIRAFDDKGQADVFTLAKAIHWAVDHGANVINMSWGTTTNSKTLHAAIQFAEARNVILVAAAGNADSDTPYYPGAYPGVIDVAATDDKDVKAGFSTYGKFISVSAPGVNIISAWPGDLYGVESGTSFSAPIVAGEAALLLSRQITDAADEIAATSVDIDSENPDYEGELGAGRVELLDAVKQ